ncbi:hypothetical protein GW17_00024666, partial [Ensete ventricosum]
FVVLVIASSGTTMINHTCLLISLMRPVDINPGNEWINMAMAGVSPQILMKSAYRSVMFYIGQQELEMNSKMKKIVGQCKQKCEVNYMKTRQKRKLDEMYDQLRSEYESVKRSAIQPAKDSFFPGAEPELFSGMTNTMGGRDTYVDDLFVADQSVFTPETPGRREMWPSTKTANLEAFDLSGGSPAKAAPGPVGSGTRRQPRPPFGAAASNPAATLHDLIISPMKRPQLSRNHARLFT